MRNRKRRWGNGDDEGESAKSKSEEVRKIGGTNDTGATHQVSTKSRVRTPDSEGNQMHSSIVWTIRI